MELSKQALKQVPKADNIILPAENVFSLPEKVLQFGTGVLLRGLPDFLINKANNEGKFNGRIVIVKSTSGGGDADTYNKQDGLYTVCVRGIDDNKKVDEIHISAAVSRVLTAFKEWDEVLPVQKTRRCRS
jgi:tagaturonate reductase